MTSRYTIFIKLRFYFCSRTYKSLERQENARKIFVIENGIVNLINYLYIPEWQYNPFIGIRYICDIIKNCISFS